MAENNKNSKLTPHTGVLYLCPTPLGNLEDITLRVLRLLKECDLIAAEDTRRTIKLLNHYVIKTPLTSYHEHNEKVKGSKLIQELLAGKNIALVSDAGMPGISDPGQVIVKMALDKGIKVVPVPGASAGITALVASGLDTGRYVFEGFLPKEKKKRRQILQQLADEERTIILYEAPHRLQTTLEELNRFLGNRKMVLARELTKVHEEFLRGSISEITARLADKEIKGELCLVIEGAERKQKKDDLPVWEGRTLIEQVQVLMKQGLSKKEAIKEVANKMGKPKREVYNEIIKHE
ncbi:uroporphyrin-III C/tetrapyrrole (Corrin/Porphyrin) methyltransferase [Thermincola ferriacetica]|uniref:Ribosomal RNA small subunit methyltransferase I n=1 Tax=Thermincola ferriacetica TaxID=281456 RepID=A0A0L6W1C1_9FIRM|nr:16S rRNA (cytidine(1402)-2'-O)-methyltransferase [Thermincola ferriacetica]KNZ69183.1 uroporphyrin-III C/tetrapyrrole (Corrin/Porphyrin) methyltransferase [Thermincola ferriacetica]